MAASSPPVPPRISRMAFRSLCAVLCNALRRDLTENQHHDRDDDGGDRGACVAVMPDEQHGADGGRGDIHDIVSDQDRGQQPVIAFEQLTDQCRPFVSLLARVLSRVVFAEEKAVSVAEK